MSAFPNSDFEQCEPEPVGRDGMTNDHGVLYLIDTEGDGWLWMEDVPSHLENHC